MINNEWLENLKVGDLVIYHTRWGNYISTVEAVNKATVKVKGLLFNKSNGFLRGKDRWDISYIEMPTEEKIAKVKVESGKRKLSTRLEKLNIENLSAEYVEKINKLLDELNL